MKKNRVIIIVSLALIAGLSLGLLNAALSFPGIVLPNASGIPVGEFGGIELINDDFNSGVGTKLTEISCSMDHRQDNGDGKIEVYTETSSEYHANFSINQTIDGYDVMMVDFDLEIDNLDDTLSIYTVYRNSEGNIVGAAPGCSQYLNVFRNGDKLEYYVSVNGAFEHVGSSSLFAHITLIYRYNRDNYRASDALVYVDGNYVTSIDGFIKSSVCKASSLRLHQLNTNNTSSPDCFYVDNYSVYVFETGYDGAINYLFGNTEYTLQECSDSILFEK